MDLPTREDVSSLVRGITSHPFVLGMGGGLLSIYGITGMSFRTAVHRLLLGAIIAAACTDAVAEYFGIESVSVQSALAFGLGAFGLYVYLAALRAIKSINWSDLLLDILRARLNSKSRGPDDEQR